MVCLVQERHVGHPAGLGLGVHHYAMPERQRDRVMVAVTHRAASINARITAHHAPSPADGFRIHAEQLGVFLFGNAARMLRANMDRLAAGAEELLHEMRFARTTTERLVTENKLLVHHHRRLGYEEPFALTAKCAVLAFVALAGRDVIVRERVTNVLRLERVHGLTHTRRAAWHGCDEPFTFVVAAQEAIKLRLLIRFADEQEQVALLRLAREDRGLNRLAQVRRLAEFEVRPVAIASDVSGVVHWLNPLTVSHLPARSDFTHLQARAPRGEPGFNVFRIHTL